MAVPKQVSASPATLVGRLDGQEWLAQGDAEQRRRRANEVEHSTDQCAAPLGGGSIAGPALGAHLLLEEVQRVSPISRQQTDGGLNGISLSLQVDESAHASRRIHRLRERKAGPGGPLAPKRTEIQRAVGSDVGHKLGPRDWIIGGGSNDGSPLALAALDVEWRPVASNEPGLEHARLQVRVGRDGLHAGGPRAEPFQPTVQSEGPTQVGGEASPQVDPFSDIEHGPVAPPDEVHPWRRGYPGQPPLIAWLRVRGGHAQECSLDVE